MYERLIERISISKYKTNFILKGGLLLSSLIGIDNRTTMDMDTALRGIKITKTRLLNVLNEIFNIDVNDGVTFRILNSESIRIDEDYGGYEFDILSSFENIKVNMSIDIVACETITPKEIEYNYKKII